MSLIMDFGRSLYRFGLALAFGFYISYTIMKSSGMRVHDTFVKASGVIAALEGRVANAVFNFTTTAATAGGAFMLVNEIVRLLFNRDITYSTVRVHVLSMYIATMFIAMDGIGAIRALIFDYVAWAAGRVLPLTTGIATLTELFAKALISIYVLAKIYNIQME